MNGNILPFFHCKCSSSSQSVTSDDTTAPPLKPVWSEKYTLQWQGILNATILSSIAFVLVAVHMGWVGPARWASSPRWDDFYPVFIWNVLFQFN